MISIVVLFIVLFATFLAVSINYTRAFKVKNQILNLIEENEGYTKSSQMDNFKSMSIEELESDGSVQAKIYALLQTLGYSLDGEINCGENQGEEQTGGFCLKKICGGHCTGSNCSTTTATYYRVTTFVNFQIPILDININIPIMGETSTFYYTNQSDDMKCF